MVEDAVVTYQPSFLIHRNGLERHEDAPLPALDGRNLVTQER
jgi:hypothetical protein